MLVIRMKHFRLGLTPARRSGHTILHVQLLLAQSAERELGMAWLWPERLDIEGVLAFLRERVLSSFA